MDKEMEKMCPIMTWRQDDIRAICTREECELWNDSYQCCGLRQPGKVLVTALNDIATVIEKLRLSLPSDELS